MPDPKDYSLGGGVERGREGGRRERGKRKRKRKKKKGRMG